MPHDTDVGKLADELLAKQPKVDDGFDERLDGWLNAKEFERSTNSWLWPGYVPSGTLTMVDAGGGSGKTRFMLAVAAMGSLGSFPFDDRGNPIKCEPFSTLYLGAEDSGEEIVDTYLESGGAEDFFWVWDKKKTKLVFDYEGKLGVEILRQGIHAMRESGHNPRNIIIDPAAAYGPKGFNINGVVEVNLMLSPLVLLAQEEDVAIMFTRHKAKPKVGGRLELNEEGQGAMTWRNLSRQQLILSPREDNGNENLESLITSGRNALRRSYGPPFAFCVNHGRISWKKLADVDGQYYVDQDSRLVKFFPDFVPTPTKGTRGPKPEVCMKAKKAILDYLESKGGKAYCKAVIADLSELYSIPQASVYRARKSLVEDGLVTDDRGKWTLTNKYDPYADGEDINENPAPWAGLED